MKKKNILIIGKKSFIAQNLKFFLKKNFSIKLIDYAKFMNLSYTSIQDVNYIINCSSNKDYVIKKYNEKNDFDLIICKKIIKLKCKYIYLSTRKIYLPKANIREHDKKILSDNYAKNKFITEKKLTKLLSDRILILRISNLIGLNLSKNNSRKIHKTFIDYFFLNAVKGIIFNNTKIFKDFLSTKQFSKIISKLIEKESSGIFNVSIGKKVYLAKLTKWLNFYNRNQCSYIDNPTKFNIDNFYLNNKKLLKEIKIKINLKDLEKDCKQISKKFFKR